MRAVSYAGLPDHPHHALAQHYCKGGLPASTTHRQLTAAEQARAGVTPGMLRLCVGIEHIDDILADLAQALGG